MYWRGKTKSQPAIGRLVEIKSEICQIYVAISEDPSSLAHKNLAFLTTTAISTRLHTAHLLP